MAKPVHGKITKKVGLKRSTPVTVDEVAFSGKKHFRFPSKSTVKVLVSTKANTAGAKASLKKLQQTYKSAGYRIMGTTDDGVVIVRPSGEPDSFRLNELEKVFSGPKNAKYRRSSF